MIEDVLIQYGVLGIWTVSLLAEKFTTQKTRKESDDKIAKLVENNTVALTTTSIAINEIKDVIQFCPKVKRKI